MNDILSGEKRMRLLGLCAKAGKLIFGTDMVCEALKNRKKVLLVVEAADTSAPTHKKLCNKCEYYGVKRIQVDVDTVRFGEMLGKSGALAAVGVTDPSFAAGIEGIADA